MITIIKNQKCVCPDFVAQVKKTFVVSEFFTLSTILKTDTQNVPLFSDTYIYFTHSLVLKQYIN
jgi:hypothetical protein